MLTLFACPKPFDNEHIRNIQRNAIRSWLLLRPRPQVILFGDEAGTAETCAEFSVMHVSEVARNEFGTPLLNDVFKKAEELSEAELLCYVNSDILLMSDFTRALESVAGNKDRFLMGARPWNLDVVGELPFEEGWEWRLSERAVAEGELRSARSCDFFVFPRGMWGTLPPFAIGRAYFDNALLHRTRQIGAALIDSTPSVTAVHQNHEYASHLSGDQYLDNDEARRNVVLAGGPAKRLTWKSATYMVRKGAVRFHLMGYLRFFGPWSRISRLWQRLRDACFHPVKEFLDSRVHQT
jgi:hypothetical protein